MDDIKQITDTDELCSFCNEQPGVLWERTGSYWCEACFEKASTAMLKIINAITRIEQQRQQPEPAPAAPAEVAAWWQRGLLSDAEALRYCVAGCSRAREEFTGAWSDLAADITTEGLWTP